MISFPVVFESTTAIGVHIEHPEQLPTALVACGLVLSRPVVVLVGGAGGLAAAELERLERVFSAGLVTAIQETHALVVDGGTDSGVMRLIGRSRALLSGSFPLVGVVARGTVTFPGEVASGDSDTGLEPHHTHFVVVPGEDWGDETPWISRTATVLAGAAPSVTLLVNGGTIAFQDVACSVEANRPVIVLAGSGRTADSIAAAVRGEHADDRSHALAASGRIHVVSMHDVAAVHDAVYSAITLSGG